MINDPKQDSLAEIDQKYGWVFLFGCFGYFSIIIFPYIMRSYNRNAKNIAYRLCC